MNNVMIDIRRDGFIFCIYDDGSMNLEYNNGIGRSALFLDSELTEVLREQLNLWNQLVGPAVEGEE